MTSLPITQPAHRTSHTLVDSIIVGVVYAAANALAAAVLGPMSRLAPSWDNLAVWALTGTLLSLTLSPLIRHSTWSRTQTTLAAWAALALVRSVGLGIEGALFKPAAAVDAIFNAVVGMLISLLVAGVAVWLMAPALMAPAPLSGDRPAPAPSAPRAWWDWTWRVAVVGLAYFVFYFVFGAANALLYTLSFYKNNPQYGLSLPPANLIFMAELIRGPLFALGALWLARAAAVSRPRLALWLGLLLFVIGGAAPYVEITFRTMPLAFNLATLTELLCQNFLTGVVAAWLLGARRHSAVAIPT